MAGVRSTPTNYRRLSAMVKASAYIDTGHSQPNEPFEDSRADACIGVPRRPIQGCLRFILLCRLELLDFGNKKSRNG